MPGVDNNLIHITPVLPTSDLDKDLIWYQEKVGFTLSFKHYGYAALSRGHLFIHLHWHADTPDDPLLGGSVVRLFVRDIKPIFEEFKKRGTISQNKLVMNTSWNTHGFGFYDLNKNAIFIVQDMKNG